MLSYTALRNKFGVITNTTGNSTMLTNADNWINDAQRIFIAVNNGDYTEATATDTTVANQQNYNLPYNYEKLNSVTVTIGNFVYPVREVTSRTHWDRLQLLSSVTASYPYSYFIDVGQIYFWPKPTTSAYTITYHYKQRVRDLSTADYVTGTLTLTNGSAAVVGSGTTFTAAMVGRYLKATTDGFWYQITSFTSTTAITLTKTFAGTTGAGLAYTIGEMPIIPEAFHQNLVDYAVGEYWMLNKQPDQAAPYQERWAQALLLGAEYSATKTTSYVVSHSIEDINDNMSLPNPNLFISL